MKAPLPEHVAGRIVAFSDVNVSADPGWPVAAPPTVRVTDSAGAFPVQGVMVGFTIMAGDGSIASAVSVTDRDGLASVGSWRIGDTASTNTVVASAPGLGSVAFTATPLVRHVAARFELRTVGGSALPLSYSGGGSNYTITGGRYILFDDGSATIGYDLKRDGVPQSGTSPLAYTFTGDLDGRASISFRVPGPMSLFYAQFGGVFATGQSVNRVMTVTYSDFIDFDIEVYELAR